MMKYAIALALASVPTGVLAQAAPATGPVTVEIVAAGQVTQVANRYRMQVTLTANGADEAAAGTALAASRTKLLQQLAGLNVREAQPEMVAPTSVASLVASFNGRSKPSFTTETLVDESDEAPKSIASEKIMFDAPSEAAVNSAKTVIEAGGGSVSDEVIPMLVDYVVPLRLAKADALKKAQSEADAYASTLGLRRATVTRVSERQDLMAGTINFVGQLVSTFAPKPKAQSEDVTVQANLVVEFQLTR